MTVSGNIAYSFCLVKEWKFIPLSVAAVCVVVIGVYAYTAQSGMWESLNPEATDVYYNSLVQGFRAGQLSVKKEAPPGLVQLADPYDPDANAPYQLSPYRLHDLSYYKGRLYLYFGITPALMLFWPFVALTGHYLLHREAVAIFCAVGFLASVGLLGALWRRYFAEASVGVVAACALALGLATALPMLLSRADVYEAAISCGYMLTMLALGAIWCALHEAERKWQWLSMASVAYGLAVGARPSLLFGGVILLVPVIQAWQERRRIGALLLAATGPIIIIGLGLMLYNFLRFDSPFEFGQHYQLGGRRQVAQEFFSLRYLWFNFRVYFLEPVRWSARSPFVHEITVPPLPAGHGNVEKPFGILVNVPIVWLALAAPLAWRSRSGRGESSGLRWFVMAVALLFGICALTLGLACGANFRYEAEFLPSLMLLAVVGILGLERALAPTPGLGMAVRPARRRAARWGWGLLLGFSVAFNLLASVENYAYASCGLGTMLAGEGRIPEAIQILEKALRITPDFAEGHFNLGYALLQAGKVREAIEHYEQGVRLKPDSAMGHYSLGNALFRVGRIPEAMRHYEQALQLQPDYAEAHNSLGVALMRMGRVQEAIAHFEAVLRIKPDHAEAHNNLAVALEQTGRIEEAIAHYEQALRIKTDFTEAQNSLRRLRAAR